MSRANRQTKREYWYKEFSFLYSNRMQTHAIVIQFGQFLAESSNIQIHDFTINHLESPVRTVDIECSVYRMSLCFRSMPQVDISRNQSYQCHDEL